MQGDSTPELKVLVVDDDESVRRVLAVALSVREEIAEVREATSGTAAVDLCNDFHPDLVFLDYWMPTMDGEATAGRIRAMCPRARIVAFSGVLEQKPDWADDHYVKGDIPDLEAVIDLTRSEVG